MCSVNLRVQADCTIAKIISLVVKEEGMLKILPGNPPVATKKERLVPRMQASPGGLLVIKTIGSLKARLLMNPGWGLLVVAETGDRGCACCFFGKISNT
jgi:hypothetical protein